MNICITGAGIISAIGRDLTETAARLRNHQSGIGAARLLPTGHGDTFPMGEITLTDAVLAEQLGLEPPLPTRTTLLGIWAVQQAIEQAGLSRADLAKAGLISASTVGGMVRKEKEYLDFLADEQSARFVHTNDVGNSTEVIADRFAIRGHVTTINTACSSSANAIILGARLLQQGLIERVIVGGTDALSRFTLNGFNALMLVDRQPCRPFDRNRQGISLGEGAAYLVLESEAATRRRGAVPLAHLAGYGSTNDAYHATSTSPNGYGIQLAMKKALDGARLQKTDIQYVNAHGTGTPNNDLTEGNALQAFFSEVPPFSSTKAFTGHTLAAAGAIETVISLLCLTEQFMPGNLHWGEAIPEHGLIPLARTKSTASLHHVLTNSIGMGGSCAALLLSKTP